MGRLMGTQIAHLKFATENFLAGLSAGLLARFFNPRRRPDLVFQPRGRPACLSLSRPGVATTLRQIALVGFGESRFTPRYGSSPRTVPRISILSQGRVSSVQFAGLDCPLAKLILFDMPTAFAA